MTESDTSCQAPAAALATLLVPVHSRGPCATCALLTAGCRCCSGSPLSQKVTLRALRAARGQRLGAVLQMDFRIVVRMVAGPSDFQEGVRVTLIDRSGQPRWSPATLEEVRPPPPVSRQCACATAPIACRPSVLLFEDPPHSTRVLLVAVQQSTLAMLSPTAVSFTVCAGHGRDGGQVLRAVAAWRGVATCGRRGLREAVAPRPDHVLKGQAQ